LFLQEWRQGVSDGAVTLDFEGCDNLFVTLDGEEYSLDSVEFHSVSEHAIGGGRFDGEAQFVHSNEDDETVIVSVLLKSNSLAGTDNPFLTNVLEYFESAADTTKRFNVSAGVALNPYTSFTPAKPSQFHYEGSLTKPPCTGDVKWFVFEQPVYVSAENLASLRTYMKDVSESVVYAWNVTDDAVTSVLDSYSNNNRPLQEIRAETAVYYIQGGVVETPSPTMAPFSATMAPSQEHRMPENAVIVGSLAIAISGVLLIVTIGLFFMVAKQHTSLVVNEMSAGEGSEQLL
jgi:hypothetical protein